MKDSCGLAEKGLVCHVSGGVVECFFDQIRDSILIQVRCREMRSAAGVAEQ